MKLELDSSTIQRVDSALDLEWIDCNQLGGWSSSTVIGAHTRSYHGILVAALPPPTDRYIMLSRLDESIEFDGNFIELSSRDFKDVIHPEGYRYLENFSLELFPSWIYRIRELRIKKSLLSINHSNSVLIRYELLNTESSKLIKFQPFIAARNYHSPRLGHSDLIQGYNLENNSLVIKTKTDLPAIKITTEIKSYNHNPVWHNNFFFRQEYDRALCSREDLICMGDIICELKSGHTLDILISVENQICKSNNLLFEEEIKRRKLANQEKRPHKKNSFFTRVKSLTSRNEAELKIRELTECLQQRAESFIVKRDQGKTILAGYHWFTDWGRDTLIAIRGLCLIGDRMQEAKAILETFCQNIKDGLVPNRFVSAQQAAEYNSVDASLWLFIASYEYFKLGGEREFVYSTLFQSLKIIFNSFCSGTIYQISEDTDGLISAGNPNIQLTWMDAKIGSWVVTPRHGKAVEINALWYNALNILKIFAEEFNDFEIKEIIDGKIEKTKSNFNLTFWNKNLNCLYDVVNQDHQDSSVRPNQVFAIGLPFPLLSQEKGTKVLELIETELLTPRGLRTLSPKDPSYRGTYLGGPRERDSAYHQGTVWPWLLGAYCDALRHYDKENASQKINAILLAMYSHLLEAGIGSISEIFDGDFPHKPRGTISQAWSVSEILRVCLQR